MGKDKALLEFSPGQTFAGHLVAVYRDYGCDPVILVVNKNLDLSKTGARNCSVMINNHVERGRAWSLQLGLTAVPEGHACFIHNVDNPYLEKGLLDILVSHVRHDGLAVPVYNGKGGHPMLLGKSVVKYLKNLPSLIDFRKEAGMFRKMEVPFPDERICWNINTQEEYRQFRVSS